MPKRNKRGAPLPPEPKPDPVNHFLREAGLRYTYQWSYQGDQIDPAPMMWADLVQRTLDMAQVFAPRNTPSAAREMLWDMLNGRKASRLAFNHRPEDLPMPPIQYVLTVRESLLMLMAHITGIRDQLIDHEREIWLLLQLSHDPRIDKRTYNSPARRRRHEGVNGRPFADTGRLTPRQEHARRGYRKGRKADIVAGKPARHPVLTHCMAPTVHSLEPGPAKLGYQREKETK